MGILTSEGDDVGVLTTGEIVREVLAKGGSEDGVVRVAVGRGVQEEVVGEVS